MMRITTVSAVFAVLLFGVFVQRASAEAQEPADSLTSIFKAADSDFGNGDYDKAREKYERLEHLGVEDAALSYNLGTVYARLGKLGEAVLRYERALRLDPGMDDARYNLSVLREFVARRASEAGRDADLAPASGPWRATLDRFSSRGAALIFLIFHLALFAVLGVRRFINSELPRLSLGVVSGVLFVLTLTTGAVAFGRWHLDTHEIEAIITVEGATDIMEGPASEVKRFSLEEGSRVKFLDARGDWTHLKDAEGRDGWVPSDALGRI